MDLDSSIINLADILAFLHWAGLVNLDRQTIDCYVRVPILENSYVGLAASITLDNINNFRDVITVQSDSCRICKVHWNVNAHVVRFFWAGCSVFTV